jgi:predicted ester cyclase
MAISMKQNKLIVKRYIEEIINTGNVERIDEFISLRYTEVYEGKSHSLGIQGAKDHILGVRQTYPDLELSVEQQLGENEWVVTLYKACGTHRGNWMGIKPTKYKF